MVFVDTICIFRTTAPSRELASFLIVILPFSRVHFVCISCALHLFLLLTKLKKEFKIVFYRNERSLYFGAFLEMQASLKDIKVPV